MVRALTIATLIACLSGWTGAAAAQDGVSEADRQRALEMFEESAEHYREGRFGTAAELLREAHALHPDPILLYNLGRALEGLGDLEGSIDAFERYLSEEPDAEDRGGIERRIETMRERLARGDDDAGGSEPVAPVEEDGAAIDPLPWVIAGVGAVGLGVGALLGGLASAKHDEAVEAPVHRDAAAAQEDADELALLANVAFAVGGAVAIGGVVWGIVDLDAGDGEPPAEATARVVVGPGSVAVRGAF